MRRVVVIGGGFCGMRVAKKLETDFEVILIDNKEYFEFTPAILKAIIYPKYLKKIQIKYKESLKNTKFILGEVDEVMENKILVGSKKIKFDYLVISSGSSYSYPIKNHDAIIANRGHIIQKHHNDLKIVNLILIVGGGLVGVELAAEICTIFNDKKIILVHSGYNLIDRNHTKTIKYVHNFLKNKNVEIILRDRVVYNSGKKFFTKKGKEINCDIAFICTGINPNSKFMERNFNHILDNNKAIIVNKHLQVSGYKNIFAGGDVTNINEEKTAQAAEKHANIIVNNIKALEFRNKLKEYKNKKRIMLISLGKWNGILEYKNFVLVGLIPAIIKFFVERKTMIAYS